MLVRRFRRSNFPSDKLVWVQHERRHHQIDRSKEVSYWNQKFYIITLLLTGVLPAPQPWCRTSASWTDGCAAIGWNWTPPRRISSFSGRVINSRQLTFTPSNSWWHRRSVINYRHMFESPHRQWANVCIPHQALDQTVVLPASSAAHCPSRPISWGCTDARSRLRHQPCEQLQQNFWIYEHSSPPSPSTVLHHPLQCILNAAARLIVKRQKFNRITASLHHKLQGYQSSTGIPTRHAFLSTSDCMELPHRTSSTNAYWLWSTAWSSLWSATNRDITYPRTNLVRFGQHSFSVISPRTWN